MTRKAGALALFTVSLFAQDIHLKTRSFAARSASAPDVITPRHRIVQFDHSPGAEDLNALQDAGLVIVGAQPDNAVIVSVPAGPMPAVTGVTWVGSMEAADKISPSFDLSDPAKPLLALVEFHSDVSLAQQDAVAQADGLTFQRPAILQANHAILSGTAGDLMAMSQHDEVAYIFPADPGLLTDTNLLPCAGMLTSSGTVGQYANIVHGWDLDSDHAAHLGYAFGSITPKVPAATVQSEVLRALAQWSGYTNVIFAPAASVSSPRTILIKFVSGAHGDPYPFDGPGGVLAHTFYPVPVNAESIAGDMHLDADENWHAGGDLDVFTVALHEAGHAIGLGHTDNPGDVMYPYYRRGVPLSVNDIAAARILYGAVNTSASAVTQPVTTTTSTPAPTPPPVALRVVLDPVSLNVQSSPIAITGTASGGQSPYSVQWQTDQGYSGRASFANAAQTSGAWTASGIPLVSGSNTISVSVFDSAEQSATQTASVMLAAPRTSSSAAGPPLSISITSPAGVVQAVNSSTLNLAGIASGGVGINRVTWQTAAGATGTASGTARWSAPGIPLLTGNNSIIVKAWDSTGAFAWAALVAVRR